MVKAPLFFLLHLAGLLSFTPALGEGIRVSGLALGMGDWISVSEGEWDTREDYGTLISTTLYWTGWGWNGSLGAPLKSSFKRTGHRIRYSPGDGEISLGRRFGNWSPRISLIFPLYDWSAENARKNELYIGSGTWDLALGMGGRLPQSLLPKPLAVQIDIRGSTVLAPALADYGSYHGLGVVQATYALGDRWKAGLPVQLFFDHWIWIPDFWDQERETRLSIVPGAVLGVRLFRATYADLKAGWGLYEYRKLIAPKYAPRSREAYYFGASLFQSFK